MYSVVLATMLAAGGTTPDFHRHSCYGCSGCYGYSSYSYHGGYSCYGSYAGYAGYGCYGSCHGFGGGWYPGYLIHRVAAHHHSYHGCYGCSGGTVVYSSCYGCCGGVIVAPPATPKIVPVPGLPTKPPAKLPPKSVQSLEGETPLAFVAAKSTDLSAARVTIHLPATARLWVDQVECPLTSSVRSFATPALNPNQQYFYNLKVEMTRDGRTVIENQRVLLTPGQETRVDFTPSNGPWTVSR